MPPLLLLEDVSRTFRGANGSVVRAVTDVSLALTSGESVGLIGESGSGKTTVGRLVLGLLKPDQGRVFFEGEDLAQLSSARLRSIRSRLQVVFQEPYESLNPSKRVGSIVEEPLIIHEHDLSRADRLKRVAETFEAVGLNESHLRRFPGELSGGQQQRVGIARAIVTRPHLIVLDEPTSSLDLSVRALILTLLQRLQETLGLSYLFISHDIATVGYFCPRVSVMYMGRIVESGPTRDVLEAPQHPYTRALLSATLSVDPTEKPPHFPLRGDVLRVDRAIGCPLIGRCPIELPACAESIPMLEVRPGHTVACISPGVLALR